MITKMSDEGDSVGRGRYLYLWTAITLYVVIVTGGVVRVTGSACPDWPMCFGSLLPPAAPTALFDYLHRLATLLSGPLLIACAIHATLFERRIRLVFWSMWTALVLTGIQAALGAIIRLETVDGGTALHFGIALIILGLVLLPTVVSFVANQDGKWQTALQFRSRFARSVRIMVLLLLGVLVSGAWAAGGGVSALGIGHPAVVLVAGFVVSVLVIVAWRSQRTQRAILTSMTIVGMLYLAQAQMGILKVLRGSPLDLLGLHVAAAAALWAAAVILLVFVGLYARSDAEESEEATWPLDWRQRVKDLLVLTKPIIVVLLLVTTYGGMVIGGKAFPSFMLTFWTLLGGALAAGGSGAVNQYIDRDIDQRMSRTAKRPIASGRMTPAEGMAYGFGLLVAAFFILAGFVNLLAALLSLAGMIYYVVLYSIYLKTTTVQNIVIGGGAGAIPPLVGWAAVTGRLEIPALLLFAIIFMWTPPHFWALALVRQNEYAKAGIPMMPVVRGEAETRRQVLIYTLELVGLTLVMWLLDFAGLFYLVCAVLLGGYLIYAAWRVWREGGNKIAWHMYRYSSMYLALLFLAMMVDAVL